MTKPNFFIIGQPKSGTTAFHEYLAGHPDVFLPPRKEIHYFCTDFHEENARLHGTPLHFPVRTERDYLSLFSGWNGERAIGEASVHYLYSAAAPAAIHRFAPDARLLVFLRNPVDFLHSWHGHSLLTNGETIERFEDALEAEPARRRGERLTPLVKVPSYLFYRERVRYAAQIARWLEHFPREQLHFVVYDDFRADNAGIYREVLRFLDLEPGVLPTFEVINARRRLRLKQVARATKHPAVKRALDVLVPRAARSALGLPALYAKLFLVPEPGSRMDPATRARLRRELRPEAEALSELLGRDFVRLWRFDG